MMCARRREERARRNVKVKSETRSMSKDAKDSTDISPSSPSPSTKDIPNGNLT